MKNFQLGRHIKLHNYVPFCASDVSFFVALDFSGPFQVISDVGNGKQYPKLKSNITVLFLLRLSNRADVLKIISEIVGSFSAN